MNSLDNSNPTNVNDIIKNFSNMVRSFAMKETEWQISKENYEKKIAQLEGELRAHENINIDLLKRIRMLEYELAKGSSHQFSKEELELANKYNTDFLLPIKPTYKRQSETSYLSYLGNDMRARLNDDKLNAALDIAKEIHLNEQSKW